jgi:glycerol-3-phosphate acyltransferase PlsX
MNMIKNGEGDVLMSGGSTGALLAAGLVVLGRLKGIKRPAIAAWFPALAEGGSTLLLDCGANVEAKPEYVYQNGIMGSIFVRAIKGIEEPSVKLLNIGAEAGKGDELHKEAFRMLSEADINFAGNIEGRDVIFGGCDIVVTDGFSGNIFLKSSEGMSLAIMGQFKKKLTEGVVAKAGAMLAYSKIKEIKKVFDYSDVGAAPILGLKGAVLKMHGNSTETEVYYAIKKAIPYVNNDVTGMIAEAVSRNNVLSAKKETGGDEEDK